MINRCDEKFVNPNEFNGKDDTIKNYSILKIHILMIISRKCALII